MKVIEFSSHNYPWYELSNFYMHKLLIDDNEYKSGEHAYQSMKFVDPAHAQLVASQPTPRLAKAKSYELGKENMWDDWDQPITVDGVGYKDGRRVWAMEKVVQAKFHQVKKIFDLINEPDLEEIHEMSYKDPFWGLHPITGEGRSMLGKLYMKVIKNHPRKEIVVVPSWRPYPMAHSKYRWSIGKDDKVEVPASKTVYQIAPPVNAIPEEVSQAITKHGCELLAMHMRKLAPVNMFEITATAKDLQHRPPATTTITPDYNLAKFMYENPPIGMFPDKPKTPDNFVFLGQHPKKQLIIDTLVWAGWKGLYHSHTPDEFTRAVILGSDVGNALYGIEHSVDYYVIEDEPVGKRFLVVKQGDPDDTISVKISQF